MRHVTAHAVDQQAEGAAEPERPHHPLSARDTHRPSSASQIRPPSKGKNGSMFISPSASDIAGMRCIERKE
ncbi:hypothetical protein GCM10010191_89560 [Actinomadura vinacea]|uniref:DUF397 domain-containing protein n=1 Tax=Actinomadura vinacea TaxID=115336 RepID=A0ABP5XN74_9ACTN